MKVKVQSERAESECECVCLLIICVLTSMVISTHAAIYIERCCVNESRNSYKPLYFYFLFLSVASSFPLFLLADFLSTISPNFFRIFCFAETIIQFSLRKLRSDQLPTLLNVYGKQFNRKFPKYAFQPRIPFYFVVPSAFFIFVNMISQQCKKFTKILRIS